MLLYKASFRRKPKVSHEDVEEAALTYMAALYRNGQVCGDYQYGWRDDRLVVVVHLPTAGAISTRQNSAWGRKWYRQVLAVLRDKPRWELLAEDEYRCTASFGRAPFLYIFSNAFTVLPPVRCGHNGLPVPSFSLPLDDTTRSELTGWFGAYAEYDRVWLASGALEKAAYRQLSHAASELSVEGRELCARIEAATKKPTYYYLMRYHGLKRGEAVRPCPCCGKPWHAHSPEDDQPFWHFHFQCDTCRLVSHCAVD